MTPKDRLALEERLARLEAEFGVSHEDDAGKLRRKLAETDEELERHGRVIREVIDLLSQSRHAFRSKQVERARKLLEELL